MKLMKVFGLLMTMERNSRGSIGEITNQTITVLVNIGWKWISQVMDILVNGTIGSMLQIKPKDSTTPMKTR